MRIGIDARIANYGATGIARYTRGVLAGLAARPRNDMSLTVLTAARKRFTLEVAAPLREKTLLTPPHSRLESMTLPLELRAQRLDLLHCMDFFAPHPRALKAIYSIHDLFFVRDNTLLDTASRRHYLRLLQRLPDATHAVCISEDTRRELLSMSDIAPERVSVIYPGCDPIHRSATPSDIATIRKTLSLAVGCVLFVGTIEPRKNIPNMVEGYALAHQQIGPLPPLVLAGREGFRGAEILAECRKIAVGSDLRIAGGVTECELAALYCIADAALFVTGGEGFGFPILEAMHAGVPVITSNRSASAEIAADAALHADPDNPNEIAAKLVELFSQPELRERLRNAGPTRAAEFSWARCGDELAALYRREAERG